MYFDRFDICAAYYVFFTLYHAGQSSREYARLSNMLSYYSPGSGVQRGELEENAQAIYGQLVRKHMQHVRAANKAQGIR